MSNLRTANWFEVKIIWQRGECDVPYFLFLFTFGTAFCLLSFVYVI